VRVSVGADISTQRHLALGALIAEKVRADPDRLLALGRRQLARMCARPDAVRARPWLDEWEVRLATGPEAVIDILTDPGEHGHDMRQTAPFAGVLSNEERWSAIREVRSAVG
jgi:hypothetical protein